MQVIVDCVPLVLVGLSLAAVAVWGLILMRGAHVGQSLRRHLAGGAFMVGVAGIVSALVLPIERDVKDFYVMYGWLALVIVAGAAMLVAISTRKARTLSL